MASRVITLVRLSVTDRQIVRIPEDGEILTVRKGADGEILMWVAHKFPVEKERVCCLVLVGTDAYLRDSVSYNYIETIQDSMHYYYHLLEELPSVFSSAPVGAKRKEVTRWND